MTCYLYSKAGRGVILALTAALLVTSATAQARKKDKGPRALAIVELPKDAHASPRLIPIAILDNGRFFDASVYLASPVPMALDSGVVYEAERGGQSVGFFTIEGAKQVGGEWVALGQWLPRSAVRAVAAARKPAPASPSFHDEADAPPVLRRPSKQQAPAPPASAPAPPPATKTASDAKAPEVANDNPVPPASEQVDPDRPTLRRGKPPETHHQDTDFELPASKTAGKAAPLANAAAKTAAPSDLFRETLVAISDAHGPQPRPYEYHWTSEEQQQLTRKVAEIASKDLVAYARSKPGLKYPPAATFDHFEVKAFDLNYDNNPELVFSGRVPGTVAARGNAKSSPAQYFYYVTQVVRQEADGELRKLFSSVTDTAHLDAFPRLDLVDVVDAEGDGRGELLFRATSDQGRSYVLYRVTRDTLWKRFEGGSAAQ